MHLAGVLLLLGQTSAAAIAAIALWVLLASADAIDALAMHWLGRLLYCPRARHRDAIRYAYGNLVLECVDCRRRQELGPVYLHGTNRTTRRHA